MSDIIYYKSYDHPSYYNPQLQRSPPLTIATVTTLVTAVVYTKSVEMTTWGQSHPIRHFDVGFKIAEISAHKATLRTLIFGNRLATGTVLFRRFASIFNHSFCIIGSMRVALLLIMLKNNRHRRVHKSTPWFEKSSSFSTVSSRSHYSSSQAQIRTCYDKY